MFLNACMSVIVLTRFSCVNDIASNETRTRQTRNELRRRSIFRDPPSKVLIQDRLVPLLARQEANPRRDARLCIFLVYVKHTHAVVPIIIIVPSEAGMFRKAYGDSTLRGSFERGGGHPIKAMLMTGDNCVDAAQGQTCNGIRQGIEESTVLSRVSAIGFAVVLSTLSTESKIVVQARVRLVEGRKVSWCLVQHATDVLWAVDTALLSDC